MASLPETATYPAGIYQLEVTDPVQGGEEGIANAQAKDLANRTKYLKVRSDEVDTARGGFLSLGDRLDRADAVVMTGEVTLYYRGVIQGFVLSLSDIRALHLSQTGTVGGGTNLARLRGVPITLPDDDYHVTVPMNPGEDAITWYAYLTLVAGIWRVVLGEEVPDDALVLASLFVQAGDTAPNLEDVGLTDLRPMIAASGWVTNPTPTVVELDPPPGHTNYAVLAEVVNASPLGREGDIRVIERLADQFTLMATGTADQVRVRWALLNP